MVEVDDESPLDRIDRLSKEEGNSSFDVGYRMGLEDGRRLAASRRLHSRLFDVASITAIEKFGPLPQDLLDLLRKAVPEIQTTFDVIGWSGTISDFRAALVRITSPWPADNGIVFSDSGSASPDSNAGATAPVVGDDEQAHVRN